MAFLEEAFMGGGQIYSKQRQSYLVRKATAEYETLVSRYQGQDNSEHVSTSQKQ